MAAKEFHCCFKQYQLICLRKDEKYRHENCGWFSWGWIFKRPRCGGEGVPEQSTSHFHSPGWKGDSD